MPSDDTLSPTITRLLGLTARIIAAHATATRASQDNRGQGNMPNVTYVQPDDTRKTTEAANGNSVMLTARRNGIQGIVARCSGGCICGTCHVYVDPDQLDLLVPMSAEEDAVLDKTAAERRPNSRLSCQIKMIPELDGLVVHVPDCQV